MITADNRILRQKIFKNIRNIDGVRTKIMKDLEEISIILKRVFTKLFVSFFSLHSQEMRRKLLRLYRWFVLVSR